MERNKEGEKGRGGGGASGDTTSFNLSSSAWSSSLSLSCDSVKIEERGQTLESQEVGWEGGGSTCSPSANMQLAATFSHLGAPDASVEPR